MRRWRNSLCKGLGAFGEGSKSTLCLPIHQSLTKDEITYIVEKIVEFGNLKMPLLFGYVMLGIIIRKARQ